MKIRGRRVERERYFRPADMGKGMTGLRQRKQSGAT